MRRRRDRGLAVGFAVAVVVALTAVGQVRRSRDGSTRPARTRGPGPFTAVPEVTQAPRRGQDDVAGFRLLVTILAGVALGASASALPNLMSTSATGASRIAVWLLWTTGVAAVVLVHLSTLTGSKIIPNEIGLVHTATLIASFLAQCGLFASLTKANAQDAVRWWFISFAAFGAAATAAVLLGLWLLPRSRRPLERTLLERYRRGQREDAMMAFLTFAASLAYVLLVPAPSPRSALTAAVIALAGMVAACGKQALDRHRMRRTGLW